MNQSNDYPCTVPGSIDKEGILVYVLITRIK